VLSWCEANGRVPTRTRFEVYGHWTGDPDAFETQVYWLLR
jgi:hypothetical protein